MTVTPAVEKRYRFKRDVIRQFPAIAIRLAPLLAKYPEAKGFWVTQQESDDLLRFPTMSGVDDHGHLIYQDVMDWADRMAARLNATLEPYY